MRDNFYDYYFRTFTGKYFEGDIDWLWIKAMALRESSLNPEAVSPAGAIGVMQVMPSTAEDMKRKYGIKGGLKVPHVNIHLGVVYARECWKIWMAETGDERIRFMLGSYNAGCGNILKAQKRAGRNGMREDLWKNVALQLPKVTGRHAVETVFYVAAVEANFNKLKAERDERC